MITVSPVLPWVVTCPLVPLEVTVAIVESLVYQFTLLVISAVVESVYVPVAVNG